LKAALIVVVLLAGVLGAAGIAWLAYVSPMGGQGGTVILKAGDDAERVAATLSRSGFVKSRRAFVIFARLAGTDRSLRAGRYAIPPGQSIRSLLTLLREGPNVDEHVTIPEGASARDIVRILWESAGVDSAQLEAIVQDASTASRFAVPGPTLEGYLFPDTYEIPWGMTPQEATALLVKQYRKAVTPEIVARAESLGLNERELITMASIVEAETGVPEERARVAAVFHNRLRSGWKLEADPTVRYATGNMDSALTRADLEVDSPYNTYLYPGLPPGPIGSPGLASIEAVLAPLHPCPDFFFVATGDGGHHFSRTIEEHNLAKARFRRRNGS
jgi:UPF0755 protein